MLNINTYNHYFFIGIAGSGMSALAQYLSGTGKKVSGSDRIFNSNKENILREQFTRMGISCYLQDGSGISPSVDIIIVSTAIEESNIEYIKASELNIPVVKRSELLAAISLSKRTIAVGGTSGKSTTTAMIFHVLHENGLKPSLINGAGLISLQEKGLPGNAWVGEGEWLVIEADESDGSIVNYYPELSVVLNIDRDHKEYDELIQLFLILKKQTTGKFIVNNDHELTRKLSGNAVDNFGLTEEAGYYGKNFNQSGFFISFVINDVEFNLPVIGKHNMENAMAAVAVSKALGISIKNAAKTLKTYRGIYRRTQLIGEKGDIYVIDDFAHNPTEVIAAIDSCRNVGNRVLAWFQPHGFGPLRFFHRELSNLLIQNLSQNDWFFISDVYYAGGTVIKDITSEIVSNELLKTGKNVRYIPDRNEMPDIYRNMAKQGDVILLMGARDLTLSDFAFQIFNSLKNI